MPATNTPKRFRKEIYRPGLYWKDGKKLYVSPADVERRRQSIERLHEVGLRIPIIYEHVENTGRGQVEGVPADPRALDENEVMRLTVGKSVAGEPGALEYNADGGLELVFEIGDENAARQLSSGAIEFVSPELRPYWQDGFGNDHVDLISHIALTHKPIQLDQRPGFVQLSTLPVVPLEGVVRLSLADLISEAPMPVTKTPPKTPPKPASKKGKLSPADAAYVRQLVVQLSGSGDDDDDGRRPVEERRPTGSESESRADDGSDSGMPPIDNAPPSNPDMPKGVDESEQQLEALLAHAAKLGIVMPSGTTRENIIERMLTAFMTLNAANDLNDADDQSAESDNGGTSQGKEFAPMNAQLSGGKKPAAPADDSASRAALVNRIRACKSLPAPIRETLLVNAGAVQFSGGKERTAPGSLSISDMLAIYEEQAVQFSAGSPQHGLIERIRKLKETGAMPPGIADNLLAKVGTVQFSGEGKEVAAGGVSVTSLIENYEAAGNVAGRLFDDRSKSYQLSGAVLTPEHPAGQQYFTGKGSDSPAGSKESVDYVNGLMERTGQGAALNPDGTAKPASQRRLAINATEASNFR